MIITSNSLTFFISWQLSKQIWDLIDLLLHYSLVLCISKQIKQSITSSIYIMYLIYKPVQLLMQGRQDANLLHEQDQQRFNEINVLWIPIYEQLEFLWKRLLPGHNFVQWNGTRYQKSLGNKPEARQAIIFVLELFLNPSRLLDTKGIILIFTYHYHFISYHPGYHQSSSTLLNKNNFHVFEKSPLRILPT